VLGGLGSVGGAALGAVIVSALPLVFQQYSDSLPLVAAPGEGGVSAGLAARFLYGALVVLIVLFQPSGLAGVVQRIRRPRRFRSTREASALAPPEPAPSPAPSQSS
jgi:branched-chain amino acid transport system permease protein